MAADKGTRRIRRRELVALAGLIAGMASAALLSHAAGPPPGTVRVAI